MKNYLLIGLLFIGVGFFLGNMYFEKNNILWKNIGTNNSYYFLQEGVYSNKDILDNNIANLSKKIIEYKDNKYYVYVGITKKKEIAEKIKSIYEKQGYKIIEKKNSFNSEEFSNNVEQFDYLIESSTSEEEILTIEEVVLANYEENSKKQY